MVGAALDVPLIDLAMSTDEVLAIDTQFIEDESPIKGLLLVLPDAHSIRLIIGRLVPDRG